MYTQHTSITIVMSQDDLLCTYIHTFLHTYIQVREDGDRRLEAIFALEGRDNSSWRDGWKQAELHVVADGNSTRPHIESVLMIFDQDEYRIKGAAMRLTPCDEEEFAFKAEDIAIKTHDVPLESEYVPVKAKDVPFKAEYVPVKAQDVPDKASR